MISTGSALNIHTSFYRNIHRQPLKIQNGKFHPHCINTYGTFHQNEKCLLPRNYQASKKVAHDIKFGDMAVIQI